MSRRRRNTENNESERKGFVEGKRIINPFELFEAMDLLDIK